VYENRVLRKAFGHKRRSNRRLGGDCIMRGFICCWCDQIKEGEMAGTCGTCGGEEKCVQGFDG
jgi:hypothetical protein